MRAPRFSFAGVALVIAVLVLAASAGLAVFGSGDRQVMARSTIGGPFALTGAGGRTVTDRDLLGRPFAIFFGYTRCPDVCPTTLAEMDAARAEIGPAADALAVVFVSVDPEHDEPDYVQTFVGSFANPVIGLTGSAEAVAAAAAAFQVHYAKVPGPDGDYLIDHTATVYLMGPDGRFQGTISYNEDHASRVAKLRRLIDTP